MKGVGLGCSPVPSPAVLRFLRIQADSLSFLASQKKTTTTTTCLSQTRHCHDAATCHKRVGNVQGLRLTETVFTNQRARSRSTYPSVCNFSSSTTTANQRLNRGVSFRGIATTPSAQRGFRPWHRIRQKPAGPLQPNDLPPTLLDDNSSLSRIVKPTNELQLRCTEFDEAGNVTLVNGAFKKSELIAKVCRNKPPQVSNGGNIRDT